MSAAPSRWSSNLLFLIIAIGTEAGIANVWKFSYLAGANGGGVFVALYFIALILVAIPALMAEMLIGRHGGRSVVGSMNTLVARDGIAPFWKVFGIMATIAVFLILSYYCVICGWMVNYFVFGLRGGFKGIDAPGAASAYQRMLANPAGMLFYSAIILAITAAVVAGGVNKGIERVSGVLTPARLLILVCLLVYSIGFADIGAAWRFLFTIDWARLTPAVVVTAVGQAFFSLGIGVGVMLTMGAYMKPEYSIPRAVFTVAFAQGLVALVAGLSIFPLVFTYGLAPAQGPGLIFVTLPVAFGRMPLRSVVRHRLVPDPVVCRHHGHDGDPRNRSLGAAGIHPSVATLGRVGERGADLAHGHFDGVVVQPLERGVPVALHRHCLGKNTVRTARLCDIQHHDAGWRSDGGAHRRVGTLERSNVPGIGHGERTGLPSVA